MTNKELALQRGLSQGSIDAIEVIHEKLYKWLALASVEDFDQYVYDKIEAYEYEAQRLWGFPQSGRYHTRKYLYEFRCDWVGRVFKCLDTGETFTIPPNVHETDFFPVGKGAIDVGRLKAYSRVVGNVVEIK